MSNKIEISNSNITITNSSNIKFGNLRSSNQELEVLVREIIDKTKSLSVSEKLSNNDSKKLSKSVTRLEKCVSSNSLSNRVALESLKTIRNVAEGITGSAIATWLIPAITKIVM